MKNDPLLMSNASVLGRGYLAHVRIPGAAERVNLLY